MKNVEDFVNRRFGALVVISKDENIGGFATWLCRCDCGKTVTIKSASLAIGKVVSCGCRINRFPNNDPKMRSAEQVWYNKYSDGNLTFEQFCELTQKNCFYCNAGPSNASNVHDRPCRNVNRKRENQFAGERGTFIYNGLDRVDPYKPHDIENVVPCCKHCNRAKLQMTIDEFKVWVCKVYEFWAKEKA